MKIDSIGLLGFGRFGKMACECLSHDQKLRVFDSDPGKLQGLASRATLEEVVTSPLILLCVPISEIESLCQKIGPMLRPGQIVADTCSVKEKPVEWMLAHLPKTSQILGTHPLFGPDSARNGIEGLKIALCPVRIKVEAYTLIRNYLEDLQLILIETTAREHDEQVAKSQAVFHLIARAMKQLAWGRQSISTPGPDEFYRLAQSVQKDTDQLFVDMECENPYAAEYRERFIKEIARIHAELLAGTRR